MYIFLYQKPSLFYSIESAIIQQSPPVQGSDAYCVLKTLLDIHHVDV